MSDPADPVLIARDCGRSYRDGDRILEVLRGVSLAVPAGSSCAIIGPSGSGKSTLLGLLAGLDTPSAGSVTVAGTDLASLSASDLAAFRGQHIGFVFQSYRLFPYATALENVRIPLELRRGVSDIDERCRKALCDVGLGERIHHRPTQLSGGEQQRVAIARALVTQPAVILADEPTGNLDAASGTLIEDMLFNSCRSQGVALVVVTHDGRLADRADRVLQLADGAMVADYQPAAVQG